MFLKLVLAKAGMSPDEVSVINVGLSSGAIAAVRKGALDAIDSSGLTEDQLQAQVERYYRQPFDLESGPIFRAALFTRSESEGRAASLTLISLSFSVEAFVAMRLKSTACKIEVLPRSSRWSLAICSARSVLPSSIAFCAACR